jgi:hypothetical protein
MNSSEMSAVTGGVGGGLVPSEELPDPPPQAESNTTNVAQMLLKPMTTPDGFEVAIRIFESIFQE